MEERSLDLIFFITIWLSGGGGCGFFSIDETRFP